MVAAQIAAGAQGTVEYGNHYYSLEDFKENTFFDAEFEAEAVLAGRQLYIGLYLPEERCNWLRSILTSGDNATLIGNCKTSLEAGIDIVFNQDLSPGEAWMCVFTAKGSSAEAKQALRTELGYTVGEAMMLLAGQPTEMSCKEALWMNGFLKDLDIDSEVVVNDPTDPDEVQVFLTNCSGIKLYQLLREIMGVSLSEARDICQNAYKTLIKKVNTWQEGMEIKQRIENAGGSATLKVIKL